MKTKLILYPLLIFSIIFFIFLYLLMTERDPAKIPSALINKKVPRANLLDEATKIATVFTNKSPTAIKLGRAAFMRTNDLDYRRGVSNAVEDFCNATMTPDAQEGLKAFLEKRKPSWE